MKSVNIRRIEGREDTERTCSLRSVSCLSCVANHSFDSAPFTPFVGFGGVALLTELRRTKPLVVEATLGGTADLALSAGLESVGGDREGDEDEMRFGFWSGVLVAVVAMIYRESAGMLVSFRPTRPMVSRGSCQQRNGEEEG
jgi:hypothetical protein